MHHLGGLRNTVRWGLNQVLLQVQRARYLVQRARPYGSGNGLYVANGRVYYNGKPLSIQGGAVDKLTASRSPSIASKSAAKPVIKPRGGVYTLRKRDGTVVRIGRTRDLERRRTEHFRDPVLGEFEFVVEHRTDDYATMRGLEQMLYDQFPNAPYNKIRPIRPDNPNRHDYMAAAYEYIFFGR